MNKAGLESQAQEIRVFNPTGEHLVTHGRKGAGPREFNGAWGMMQDRDGRLWIPDHVNARMSVIDVDSGIITSYPMRREWKREPVTPAYWERFKTGFVEYVALEGGAHSSSAEIEAMR